MTRARETGADFLVPLELPLQILDRPIVLGGFMAAGKSTVGRLLARDLGVPFLDLDGLIEARCGKPSGTILASEGEGAFRKLEGEIVRELLPLREVVVALGGGTLEDRELRGEIVRRGLLVGLVVSAETARRRAAGDQIFRPLLAGDAAALLSRRAPGYASAAVTVDTEGRFPEQVAEEIRRRVFGTKERARTSVPALRIDGGVQGPIFVGDNILREMETFVPDGVCRPFLVGDDLTVALFGAQFPHKTGQYLLPRGERAKDLDRVRELYGAFAAEGLDRWGTVGALGGGTVGDCAGFASATWLRGVSLLQCPTTLLSMVDSSVGGKTGVNLPQGKNLVGAFYPPRAVVADVRCLRSLPEEEFRQGLAEAVKYAVGEDQTLLAELDEARDALRERDPEALVRLVARCVALKLAVVAQDERETSGVRCRLNLGHTVGHALEGASDFRWKHGDAVAAGLLVVLDLGVRSGSCSRRFEHRVRDLLARFDLERFPDLPWESLEPFLAHDKKVRHGSFRAVLPVETGPCVVRSVSFETLRRSYEEVMR